MEMRLIHHLIQHFNKHVRKYVFSENSYCLTLDGHSSRKGFAWLEYCQRVSCEVLQLPSDTTHFLQPCDQKINKSFKRSLKTYRNMLCRLRTINMRAIRTKSLLAIIGYESVTEKEIIESFELCGLWPMNYRFINLSIDDTALNTIASTNLHERQSDVATLEQLKSIIQSRDHASIILQKASNLLTQQKTVHGILSNEDEAGQVCTNSVQLENTKKVLQRGAPATCLTLGDIIEKRKVEIREKQAARVHKEKQKAAKKVEQEKRRVLQAITGSHRGEKKRKVDAVQGLLSLVEVNHDVPNNPLSEEFH